MCPLLVSDLQHVLTLSWHLFPLIIPITKYMTLQKQNPHHYIHFFLFSREQPQDFNRVRKRKGKRTRCTILWGRVTLKCGWETWQVACSGVSLAADTLEAVLLVDWFIWSPTWPTSPPITSFAGCSTDGHQVMLLSINVLLIGWRLQILAA